MFVNTNLAPAPLAVVIFSIVYLFNINYDIKNVASAQFSGKNTAKIFIILLILIDLSLVSFLLRPELYSRPMVYFILTSFVSGLLALMIMYLPHKRKYEYLALLLILTVGLSVRLLQQTLFPDLLGMDPYTHRNFTLEVMSVGHLVEGFAYSRLPSMHILIASVSFITGLSYKWSSIASVTIPQLISIIIVYLIGKKIFNAKVGLLAALFLCMSANYITLGYWIFPTGLAMIFSAFLLYYIIKEDKKNSIANNALKILFAISIISIHMQVALAILIFLIFFWIGKKIYIKIQNEGLNFINSDKLKSGINKIRNDDFKIIRSNKVKIGFVILFAVLMFSWWIYVVGKIDLPVTLIQRALEHDPSQIREVSAYSQYPIPYYQYLLNILPYLFFYGFSIIGFLYAISKKTTSNYLALTLGGVALLAVPFLLLESNMSGYLSERWIYTAQLFMSIPVAIGVLKVFKVTQKKTIIKNIAIVSIISIFIFVNVIAPSANIDNSEISKYSVLRVAYTDSEFQSMNTLQKIMDNTYLIYTDKINGRVFSNKKVDYLDKYLHDKKYSDLRGFVILRPIIATEPVLGMKLNYNPIPEISQNDHFIKVYDSGSELAFINIFNPKIRF